MSVGFQAGRMAYMGLQGYSYHWLRIKPVEHSFGFPHREECRRIDLPHQGQRCKQQELDPIGHTFGTVGQGSEHRPPSSVLGPSGPHQDHER